MQVSINAFLRNPPISGRSHQQLYGEFLEMMEYADQNGIARVALAEHHFEDDGYLPSQFVMAGAIAARTKRMEIWFAIMVLPLHHPLSVAEDGAVLDCLSGGRFTLGVAGGYHHKEFDGFGVPRNERGGAHGRGARHHPALLGGRRSVRLRRSVLEAEGREGASEAGAAAAA